MFVHFFLGNDAREAIKFNKSQVGKSTYHDSMAYFKIAQIYKQKSKESHVLKKIYYKHYIENLKKSTAYDSHLYENFLQLYYYYNNLGSYNEAIYCIERAEERLHFSLSVITNKSSKVKAIFKSKSTIFSELIKVKFIIGHYYQLLGKFEHSTSCFSKSIDFYFQNINSDDSKKDKEFLGLYLSNIILNYFLENDTNQLKSTFKSKKYASILSRIDGTEISEIIKNYEISFKSFPKNLFTYKSDNDIKSWCKNNFAELSNQSNISEIIKLKKRIIKEYGNLKVHNKITQLGNSVLGYLNSLLSDTLANKNKNEKELKNIKLRIKRVNKKRNKTPLDSATLSILLINKKGFEDLYDLSHLAYYTLKKRIKDIKRMLKQVSYISFRLKLKWLYILAKINISKIIISVIFLGTVIPLYLKDYIVGVGLSVLLTLLIFIIDNKIFGPWLEKKFIDLFKNYIRSLIVEINSKLFLKINFLLEYKNIINSTKKRLKASKKISRGYLSTESNS